MCVSWIEFKTITIWFSKLLQFCILTLKIRILFVLLNFTFCGFTFWLLRQPEARMGIARTNRATKSFQKGGVMVAFLAVKEMAFFVI